MVCLLPVHSTSGLLSHHPHQCMSRGCCNSAPPPSTKPARHPLPPAIRQQCHHPRCYPVVAGPGYLFPSPPTSPPTVPLSVPLCSSIPRPLPPSSPLPSPLPSPYTFSLCLLPLHHSSPCSSHRHPLISRLYGTITHSHAPLSSPTLRLGTLMFSISGT